MAQWKEISTNEEWNHIFEGSTSKPVVVLKHSTACPVSSNALDEYESYLGTAPNQDVDYILVKVIESRPVSNQIAEDTGVKHASPQILYIKNKETIWNTSHWSITKQHMNAVLN
ncbi:MULTISPECIES: bacillithiol system redox-active protein YtxJ [unclassified Paenibacillus]|uniref:bacillithiol system redox-active protein YtxJ n=1 Tax=unclassified Paenibacillus TaxID=185978 RepID=UPI001AEA5536|nr:MULTISPECIES: bacillithiol system redox-active protein YtxJ [unclassified Paenibacillus]MBP1155518.1 bacillithiol system protein YtxJ [Paenibacillus sp. PvP091]MBP1169096.1 bacillithiol system protein YtxJ [Paenibacillus sp. PvR098]MBP2440124.1 bacillithiol system protein YtxJ [Paenibacillus sp. PvP052]